MGRWTQALTALVALNAGQQYAYAFVPSASRGRHFTASKQPTETQSPSTHLASSFMGSMGPNKGNDNEKSTDGESEGPLYTWNEDTESWEWSNGETTINAGDAAKGAQSSSPMNSQQSQPGPGFGGSNDAIKKPFAAGGGGIPKPGVSPPPGSSTPSPFGGGGGPGASSTPPKPLNGPPKPFTPSAPGTSTGGPKPFSPSFGSTAAPKPLSGPPKPGASSATTDSNGPKKPFSPSFGAGTPPKPGASSATTDSNGPKKTFSSPFGAGPSSATTDSNEPKKPFSPSFGAGTPPKPLNGPPKPGASSATTDSSAPKKPFSPSFGAGTPPKPLNGPPKPGASSATTDSNGPKKTFSSPFGAGSTDSKPASPFGGAGSKDSKPASSPFGSGSTDSKPASPFGAASKDSKPASSPFGSGSTDSKPASPFGAASKDSKPASSPFGSGSTDSKPASPFGAGPKSSKPASSPFGSGSTDSKPASPFGAASKDSKPASSPFGSGSTDSKPASPFGAGPKSSKPASSPFGSGSTDSKPASPFGAASKDSKPASSPFGAGSTDSKPASPFGAGPKGSKPASSPFGAAPEAKPFKETATSNPFQQKAPFREATSTQGNAPDFVEFTKDNAMTTTTSSSTTDNVIPAVEATRPGVRISDAKAREIASAAAEALRTKESYIATRSILGDAVTKAKKACSRAAYEKRKADAKLARIKERYEKDVARVNADFEKKVTRVRERIDEEVARISSLLEKSIRDEEVREKQIVDFRVSLIEAIGAKKAEIAAEDKIASEIAGVRSKLKKGTTIASQLDGMLDQKKRLWRIDQEILADLNSCLDQMGVILADSKYRAAKAKIALKSDMSNNSWKDVEEMEALLDKATLADTAESKVLGLRERIAQALLKKAQVLEESVSSPSAVTGSLPLKPGAIPNNQNRLLGVKEPLEFDELKKKDERELLNVVAENASKAAFDGAMASFFGLRVVFSKIVGNTESTQKATDALQDTTTELQTLVNALAALGDRAFRNIQQQVERDEKSSPFENEAMRDMPQKTAEEEQEDAYLRAKQAALDAKLKSLQQAKDGARRKIEQTLKAKQSANNSQNR